MLLNECEFCKEINIVVGATTNTCSIKEVRLCHNPTLMVIRPGGVLLQYCPYNNEKECPYES